MPDEKEKNDFQYIVRIASMDLNGERDVVLALADLKGIGVRLAETLTKKLNIDESMRLGDLSEEAKGRRVYTHGIRHGAPVASRSPYVDLDGAGPVEAGLL